MALDAYAPCPCGSGEKYKFCCPKELHADFERVLGLIDGEQRAAALDACERILVRNPNQACFLTLQLHLLFEMGELDRIAELANHLRAVAPKHPNGHAALALISASEGDSHAAIDLLQDAFERSPMGISYLISWALEAVIFSCFSNGAVFAAMMYARCYIQQRTTPEGQLRGANERVLNILREIQTDSNKPPVINEFFVERLCEQPALAAIADWLPRFIMCRFRELRGESIALQDREPRNPYARFFTGLTEVCLGRFADAAARFREVAQMAEAPECLAVDAFLLAKYHGTTDFEFDRMLVLREFEVADVDRLIEYLASDRRFAVLAEDPRLLAEEGEPPPKAAYHVCDRPIPVDMNGLDLGELPILIGSIVVFGRQTDRAARMMIQIAEDQNNKAGAAIAASFPSGLIGPQTDEQTTDVILPIGNGLIRDRYFRGATSFDVPTLHNALIDEGVRGWPDQRHPYLDGKRPIELVGTPEWRIPLTAVLLLLETTAPGSEWTGDFTGLWERLGLRRDLAKDSAADGNRYPPFEELGLTALARVDPKKCSDPELLEFSAAAASYCVPPAAVRLVMEVLDRERLPNTNETRTLVMQAAIAATSPTMRIDLLERAIASRPGEPADVVGLWKLQLFDTLIRARRPAAAIERLQEIMTTYRGNQSIMHLVAMRLQAMGFMDESGRPLVPEIARTMDQASRGPSDGTGAIWTPDRPAPQPSTAGAPSKLWLPGS
ncbi:MAG: hypothetical protein FJ297_03445 [Planctomycetes bacterium]|nr:hypothetical protein [Planctomycetota bacterium]